MSPTPPLPFLKMNGLGNEIVVVDLRGSSKIFAPGEAAAIAADRGSRFDQLMVLHDPKLSGTEAFVRIYNADGSEAGACGNGMRCVAWMLERAGSGKTFAVETRAGRLSAVVADETAITVDMGKPRFDWQDIPLAEEFRDTRSIELQVGPIDDPVLHSPSVVNVGNPHAIFWVDDVEAYDLERFGPLLENHPIFPERANISLAQVLSRDALRVRTWERGAGLTKACGSAACASAVTAARKRLTDRKVNVMLPGGSLTIEWRPDDHILMTGPVEFEYEGAIDLSKLAAAV
ncbi:diaminopimelate epimerase [Hyphomicrobium methylovorum]|uniref:diaminopimelate epimerase n=1 Tax=Hyphomicrobium methylovorum TaxID=84 RepID=UPI0015E7818F|nr:diaminopimelate epimerase [Hyphomicrobium methylovorum]MBA2126171.1 diaminopimelate epimerase [Hyphomicrobium methylovorum]